MVSVPEQEPTLGLASLAPRRSFAAAAGLTPARPHEKRRTTEHSLALSALHECISFER